MRLLMVSGDRQVTIGERGPFHSMQREFSRYFERVDVICPSPPGEVTVRSIHDNVFFHPASCGRAGMVGYIKQRGAELVREHQPALIVSHDYGWFYNGIGSAKLSAATGVPYLSEIHHVPGYPVAADWRERFDQFIARRYIAWARSRALAFRVVNQQEMPQLLRGWGVPKSQILVLPSLYIDLEVFQAAESRSEPEFDLLYVGRMVNNKGLLRIADALDGAARQGHEVRALFVGRGPFREKLKERLRAHGILDRSVFIDWVDTPLALAEYYRKSRVVVCASTCEGGPRFTVEAMACGTPVVSTRVGVMSELLEEGGGLLCGFDEASLSEALIKLWSDPALWMRCSEDAQRIAGRFGYHEAIAGYALGLQRLVGESEGIA